MYFQSYLHKKFMLWPHEKNAKSHPSFHSYLEYHLKRFETGDIEVDDFHAYGQHLSLSAYKKFTRGFDDANVRVFNLHWQKEEEESDGDLFVDFVCQMVPTAPATCRRLSEMQQQSRIAVGKSRNSSNNNSNKRNGVQRRASRSFDAERLAMAAYERKIVDGKSISKKDLAKRTAKRLEETRIHSDGRYLSCLSESLKSRFLNASQSFERDLADETKIRRRSRKSRDRNVDDDPSANVNVDGGLFDWNETLHAHAFEKAVRDGKFCEIDTNKVLKNESWVDFFARNNK